MITYTLNGHITINVRQWTFPGGEVGVDINAGTLNGHLENGIPRPIRVDAQLTSANDIMALLLTVDALRREYLASPLWLFLPYVPYARQDRLVNDGESVSIAVMAKLINSCGFTEVVIADPHSPVTPALIDNVHVLTQSNIFSRIHHSWDNWIIVAPDQGATKKCEEFAKVRNARGVITCEKRRDLHTGKITGMRIVDGINVVKDSNLLVLDDICDGGRTFIELAELLRELKPAKLELAVTHGIFSKGFGIVGDYYDSVYTTDSFPQDGFPNDPKLKVFSLK
jgi:ribose-phosphate pyrophosphokinase